MFTYNDEWIFIVFPDATWVNQIGDTVMCILYCVVAALLSEETMDSPSWIKIGKGGGGNNFLRSFLSYDWLILLTTVARIQYCIFICTMRLLCEGDEKVSCYLSSYKFQCDELKCLQSSLTRFAPIVVLLLLFICWVYTRVKISCIAFSNAPQEGVNLLWVVWLSLDP